MKNEPFARTINDPKVVVLGVSTISLSHRQVDAMYREKIHAEDPMAQYMMSKRQKKQKKTKAEKNGGGPERPVYKGPTPRPNRFEIQPGYRWDGRDRGNGWEDRLLKEISNKNMIKEAAHEWSVADM